MPKSVTSITIGHYLEGETLQPSSDSISVRVYMYLQVYKKLYTSDDSYIQTNLKHGIQKPKCKPKSEQSLSGRFFKGLVDFGLYFGKTNMVGSVAYILKKPIETDHVHPYIA